MKRVHNFLEFCRINEGEYDPIGGANTLYDEILNAILGSILDSYTSIATYAGKEYSNSIINEVDRVRKANLSTKVSTMESVLQGAKNRVFEYSIKDIEDIAEKWFQSGSEAIKALKLLMEEYKTDADELENILNQINQKIDEYKESLVFSANESLLAESALFERVLNIFSGKAGQKNISNEIVRIKIILDTKKDQEGMGPLVYKYTQELDSMSKSLKTAKEKLSKRDLEKKIEEALTRILQIEKDINAASSKYLKQLEVKGKAGEALKNSLKLAEEAKKLEETFWLKAQREKALRDAETKREDDQRQEDSKLSFQISKPIYYDPEKEGKYNEDVQKVQKLISDKIESLSLEKIKSLPEYEEFKKYGDDGKFGKKTAKIIKILKVGMGEYPEDVNSGITLDFVRDLQTRGLDEQRAEDYAKGKEVSKNSFTRSYEKFLKLSIPEKMDWLTSKYVAKTNPDVFDVGLIDNSGNIFTYIIYWSGKDSKFPKGYFTECSSPENENSPGYYATYKEEEDGNRIFREAGYWGESIGGSGVDFKKSENISNSSGKEDLVWNWGGNNQ